MTKLFVSILVSLIITTMVTPKPVSAQPNGQPEVTLITITQQIILSCVQANPTSSPIVSNIDSSSPAFDIPDCDTGKRCVDCLFALSPTRSDGDLVQSISEKVHSEPQLVLLLMEDGTILNQYYINSKSSP